MTEGPEALASFILSTNIRDVVTDELQIVEIPKHDLSHTKGIYASLQYLPEIKHMCVDAQERIMKIIDSNHIPIILMGNDSSLMGALSGISKKKDNNYGLIYFDAHGDLNTPDVSLSGRIYGMPLAHLLGFGDKRLTELNGQKPAVKSENVVLIGQRSLDSGEEVFIQDHELLLYTSDEANRQSSNEIKKVIDEKFSKYKITELVVHIDLDVLDPLESHGVSMHEPSGLHVDNFFMLLKEIKKMNQNIIGLSISEYNPRMDKSNKTRDIVLSILKIFI